MPAINGTRCAPCNAFGTGSDDGVLESTLMDQGLHAAVSQCLSQHQLSNLTDFLRRGPGGGILLVKIGPLQPFDRGSGFGWLRHACRQVPMEEPSSVTGSVTLLSNSLLST